MGKTLEYDRIQYALYQLNSAFELRISEDTDTILNYRLNGVPYKVSTVNGQQTNDICPYSWESLEYVSKTIGEAGRCANEILAEYGIELTPNWKEINKQWFAEVDRLEKLFGDALGKATQAALNNQAYKYQQAYNEELSKDFGLSFGVLSSSLTAHLLYAAQSAAKERKDHARAEKAASEVMQNSHADITSQIFASVYPLYVDSLEPAMQKLLSQYYAYIISIFSKELGYSYEDVATTFDFKKSNGFILGISENAKDDIFNALQADPNNGNVIGYAIKNGVLDNELCTYGKCAHPNFGNILKKWAISVLSEIYNAGKLFNKPLVTNENESIITGLISYYTFVSGIAIASEDWQDIILEIYGEEIDKVEKTFEIFAKVKESNSEIIRYAQENKKIMISDDEIAKFIVVASTLKHVSSQWYATCMDLDANQSIAIQEVRDRVSDVNAKIDAEKAILKKKAEERRRREEHQKILEEERKAELKKQEEIRNKKIKKKIKISSIVIAILLVAILIFNIFAMPPIYYNIATTKYKEQKYGEAAILYSKARNYEDAMEKCYSSWANVSNKLVASGDGTFGMALKEDGRVVAAGNNNYGQCNVGTWDNIVSVYAGCYHAVGLTAEGTVVAVGENSSGECNVENWENIVAIAAGDKHTIGLKNDGTVIATGENDWGQCNVKGWKNIIAIAAGDYHTVGLKKDGTVVSTNIVRGEGARRAGIPYFGQTDVSTWTNIVAIDANEYQTVGLTSDGTVVSTTIDSSVYSVWQPYYHNQDKLSGWRDIAAISVGRYHVVGLKNDGTVISTKFVNGDWGDSGQCDVSSWNNIVAVASGASDYVTGQNLVVDGGFSICK